jgi:hypothetical protein
MQQRELYNNMAGGEGINAETLDPRQSALLYTFFYSFLEAVLLCFNGACASGVRLIRI